MERGNLILTSENHANHSFAMFMKGLIVIIVVLLSPVYVIGTWVFIQDLQDLHLDYLLGHLILLLIALNVYLAYSMLYFGLKPLRFYEYGIEIPDVAFSWRVRWMKKNNIFPTIFLSYNDILKIQTIFNKKGKIYSQIIYSDRPWICPWTCVQSSSVFLDPPLAKEVMGALQQIVGTAQLVTWLNKGGMKFCHESMECKTRSFQARRELFGDEVTDELNKVGEQTPEKVQSPSGNC